ncbi:MAG: hypothetical protein ACKODX_04265, partial [Gemmata sp.]
MLHLTLCVSVFAAPVRVVPGATPAEVTVVARLPDQLAAGALSQRDGEARLRFVLLAAGGDSSGPAMLGT